MNQSEYNYSIVVPCFNEAWIIRETVKRLRDVFVEDTEIILVDDGSHDNTSEIIRELEVEYVCVKAIMHAENRGKGESVRSGVMQAKGKFIGFIDADLEIDPNYLAKMFFVLTSKEADIVIGNKNGIKAQKSRPLFRRFLSSGYKLVLKIFFNLPVEDTQVGIKVFSRNLALSIFEELPISGHAFDLSILLAVHNDGYAIFEIPVTIKASSKVSSVRPSIILQMIEDTMKLYRDSIIKRRVLIRDMVLYPISWVITGLIRILALFIPS